MEVASKYHKLRGFSYVMASQLRCTSKSVDLLHGSDAKDLLSVKEEHFDQRVQGPNFEKVVLHVNLFV